MLQPKRTKFRKQFKGRNRGLAYRGNGVAFGEFGLKTLGRGRAPRDDAFREARRQHLDPSLPG